VELLSTLPVSMESPTTIFRGTWRGNCRLVLCCAFQCYMAAQFIQRIIVVGRILDAVKTSLQTTLNIATFLHTVNSKRSSWSFEKYSCLVLVVSKNLNLLMKFVTSWLVPWVLIIILTLILNFYIFLEYNHYNAHALCLLLARTMTTVVGTVFVFYIHDTHLKAKVSRRTVLIFIYHFPLSTRLKLVQ
jgi:hypothetical protein